MSKVVPLLIFTGAALSMSSSSPRDARADVAFKVPVVTVHAKEFAFTAPATIAPGQTTFHLVNDGKLLHHLQILQLGSGKTFADLQAAMKKPGAPPPAWLIAVGGPNAAVPGGSVDATVTLEAGNYVIACYIPSPGDPTPHMMKGMIQPLAVKASAAALATNTFAATPAPDVHLVMKDYGFAFSKPLTKGKHVIHVMNEGPQEHEAIFIKLAPGKHVSDFNTWATTGDMKGPPPAKPVDGMAGLAKGRTGIFTANLTPGTYALICFAPDAKDGKSHAEHGMTQEFEVK